MSSILNKIDLFGYRINFKFNNSDKFKTLAGGLLTIIGLSITITFAFLFCKDFYQGTNPRVYTSVEVRDKYEEAIPLTYDRFIVPWRLEKLLDKSFIDIEKTGIYVTQMNSDFQLNKDGKLQLMEEKKIPLKKCSQLNITLEQFTKNFSPDEWYCFDWSGGNFKFGGHFDGHYVAPIKLVFSLCPNGQKYNKQNCSTVEEVKKKNQVYNGLLLNFLYQDSYMVSDDLQNPLKMGLKSYVKVFDFNTYYIDRLYFERRILYDDQGKVFENIQDKSVLSFTRNRGEAGQLFDQEGGSGVLMDFLLYGEKNSNIYKRSFMKLQDAGALIGGIVKAIMNVFMIAALVFNTFDLEKFFIENLFETTPLERNQNNNKDITQVKYLIINLATL